jgi:hypothetical protein
MKFGTIRTLVSGIFLVSSSLALANESRFIISDDKQFAYDITSGLIWKRCNVGKKIENAVCTPDIAEFPNNKYGVPEFRRDEALEYLNKKMPGWRIPTTNEFVSLIQCKSRANGGRLYDGRYDSWPFWFDEKLGLFRRKWGDGRFVTDINSGDEFQESYSNGLPCGLDTKVHIRDWDRGSLPTTIMPEVSKSTVISTFWTADLIDESMSSYVVNKLSVNSLSGALSRHEAARKARYENFRGKAYAIYWSKEHLTFRLEWLFVEDSSKRRDHFFNLLLPVIHESELKTAIPFSNRNPNEVAETALKLTATKLSWKHDGKSSPLQGSSFPAATVLKLDLPVPTLYQQLVTMTNSLVAQENKTLPVLPALPERSAFVSKVNQNPKGEFETTAGYEERIKRDTASAAQQDEERYQAALSHYKNQVKLYEQRQIQAQQNQGNPAFYQRKLEEAWKQVAQFSLGNPTLENVRYDADQQVFLATLRSSIGSFSQEISAAVPLQKAAEMKQLLLSGKVAPQVDFEFPSMKANWILLENAAMRTRKFDEAKTVEQLESVIAEYPTSNEAKSARQRIFTIPATSKELAALILRHRDWPEATAANPKLQALQTKEFKEASAANSVEAYDKFYKNFGEPDLANVLSRAKTAYAAAVDRQVKDEQKRQQQACDSMYVGKAVGFAPSGWIYSGVVLKAVVIGKSGKNVSLKITDSAISDDYGKTFEIPCGSSQIK